MHVYTSLDHCCTLSENCKRFTAGLQATPPLSLVLQYTQYKTIMSAKAYEDSLNIVGGWSGTKPATPEVQKLADKVSIYRLNYILIESLMHEYTLTLVWN